MPSAIIAGMPLDLDRRVQKALPEAPLPAEWTVRWYRSKGRSAGLAPSQTAEIRQIAGPELEGAHVLVFHGQRDRNQDFVLSEIAPYFRTRWLDHAILKWIPHLMESFFGDIAAILQEELEWANKVKPKDQSSCLLLPACAFLANSSVKHVWDAAAQPGAERIRLATAACERFRKLHWLPDARSRNGIRAWTDVSRRIFDHRGERHGAAPFPRSWKLSYQIPVGFHFDVQAADSRPFQLRDAEGVGHYANGGGHINMDAHGYVRA